METEEEKITRIAKTIDPDGTFLNECEEVVKNRFGEDLHKIREI